MECTTLLSGLMEKAVVVAGVVMVVMSPLLMKLTIPSGPKVLKEKEAVGCREGGLKTPLIAMLVVRVAMSAEKQLLIDSVKETKERKHVVVVKEADAMAKVPKETVGGNKIWMYPLAGMGSAS